MEVPSGSEGILVVAAFLMSMTDAFTSLLLYITRAGGRYRIQRFGRLLGTALYAFRLVDTDALQRSHWDINSWTDAEVLAWKNSHIEACNAIAVAAAIFASVGLTALQLPNMDAVHWSARATCASSMVLGVISVITATRAHQTVGMLNSPLDIRLWLSRGRPTRYFGEQPVPFRVNQMRTEKYAFVKGFHQLPLESSVSALKEIAFPRHLLSLAVLLYLIGFGLYVLFLWLDNIETSGQAYRNIFIVFIITVGLYIMHDGCLSYMRLSHDNKRNTEFGTAFLGGFSKPDGLLLLQHSLNRVQEKIKQWSALTERELRGSNEELAETQSHPRRSVKSRSFIGTADSTGKVDKYELWQRYLTSYMQKCGGQKDKGLLLKIMEMKGSFEADWDNNIAIVEEPVAEEPSAEADKIETSREDIV